MKEKCAKCKLDAVKDGFCRKHYIEEKEKVFLDNTNHKELGILKWLKFMYPEHYRNEFSEMQKEVYIELLSLYDRRLTNKMHRLFELIAFRGFSKSKIIFGIISYITLHNNQKMKIRAEDGMVQEILINEKFIVIFSETGGMAEDFVVNIRDEFSTNSMVKYFYKYTIQDAKEEDTGQWTRKAFKMNNLVILGLGAQQQARGKIKGAYRPTFVFYDDIYSENNTKTEQTRNNIKRWFYDAAQHSVDDLLGKAFLVGTIINDDTVIIECEKSNTWKTKKVYPMPEVKFQEFINKHLKIDINKSLCKLPFDQEEDKYGKIEQQTRYFNELEKDSYWEIEWKERMGLYQLALKYKEAVENQNISGFYQEYFHIAIPTELRRFRKEYFRHISDLAISKEFGYTWLECKEIYPQKEVINIEIGLDLSSGTKEGDNTSIVITGITGDGKCFVLKTEYGKFSIRDNVNSQDLRIDRIVKDISFVSKIGYIDETFRLSLEYNPRLIKVGTGGGLESSIVDEMVRIFRINGNYIPIIPRIQSSKSGTKEERIINTLLPKYETMSVYHTLNMEQLEYELEFLGKASNDDTADALEVSIFNIYRPYPIKYTQFTEVRKFNKFSSRRVESDNWLEDWKVN